MKKETGGYLELEVFSGEEYHAGLYRLNLARTALALLLRVKGYKKIYMPYFICGCVITACEKEGAEIVFYHINEELEPLLPDGLVLSGDEALYLVNVYGQLTDERIKAYKNRYGNIIADNTHAFFQRPVEGVDTVYSVRKFFGVSDGAYLYTDAAIDTGALEQDLSFARMEHLLGRFEQNASLFYAKMRETAEAFKNEPVKRMSALTENLLRATDYRRARIRRNENYALLSEHFPEINICRRTAPDGPLTFPLKVNNGPKIRKKLAEDGIYIPVYWTDVLEAPASDFEKDLVLNFLALPCDQRYSKEDMRNMAAIVKTVAGAPG